MGECSSESLFEFPIGTGTRVIGIPCVSTGDISTIESSIHSDEDGDVSSGDKLQGDIFAPIKNAEAANSSPSSLAFRLGTLVCHLKR